ncbi:NADP-dependent oxidoreductase [Flavobacterium sp. WLB]|uniref:NADP-dependent oxidoreductase n=1 Tax=unclassified Flavobacterium TaxID=196869 RepID=UPI0006ABBC0F|nr:MULTISPECIES: NADP-dependent oxidoreductase [unclassified Flavobacterium]KOP38821.1 NADPH:quinone oxidoreductase [Flavobacterium sp. VMW]OWU92761.1 NADPH:quinone oxidoreductase [Flavobacterium sp. NLM]PUU71954.1 NADP-dependent oxidoreductase [Flavobacterium sp. WLB]
MKAYILPKYGKTEKLLLSEVKIPEIGDYEVLVEIHAASINQLDLKIKNGDFKLILPYQLPLILGHDIAGIVVETGSKVSRFKIGDQIFGRAADFHIGSFAEYIAVNENDLAVKPINISMEQAASIPLVGLTVWQAFVEKAKLRKGQKVFIQAGSGGVGTIAIQFAKHLGAFVATTASEKNFDMLKALGADIIIDYKKDNFENILKDYDVVLNSQDVKTLEKSLTILKPGGSIISISGPPTPEFAKSIGASAIIRFIIWLTSLKICNRAKNLNVNYSFLFMKANGRQLEQIADLLASEIIKPIVDKIFPFEQTNDAFNYLESGHAKGKVVVKVK